MSLVTLILMKDEKDGAEAQKKQRRSNYEGFSEYMDAKENKLRAQFDSTKVVKSEIFRGICIHVNGLTKPPLSVLRSLILSHGGAFEQYYNRDKVTHFICTHVAKAKLENFIKRSNGKIKVMNPKWITDSIQAGKLLDEFNYRVYLNLDAKQNNLHQFFEEVKKEEKEEIFEDNEDFYDPEALDYEQLQDEKEPAIDNFDMQDDDIDLLADMIDEIDNEDISDSDSKSVVIKSPEKSKTSADPQFLSDYYRSSRLHHISIWREELKVFAANLMKTKSSSSSLAKKLRNEKDEKIIMHVDVDCFFVSVSLLSHPERDNLKGKPIAVSHARNDNLNILDSSADISSCNYEARAFGVRSEMYIREALKICPDLKIIPYDFEGYNRISREFYEILSKWADELQAVSCDEAYLDLSSSELEPEEAAQEIRNEIRSKCGIDVSIGIGPNLLIARLATRRAKPNGQFRVKMEEINEFMSEQLIENLPGVGDSLIEKLPASVVKCSDILEIPLSELQSRLGHRQGLNLYRKVRGEDDRIVGTTAERKSVGSEVSWGVRFASVGQCRRFLDELGGEVWQRMLEAFPTISEPKPKRLQIKLYRRQEGAGAAKKHLGRGICDTFHRSKTFPKGLTQESIFITEIWQLFESEFLKGLSTSIEDVRGIGIFLSEFACNNTIKQTHKDISELFNNSNRIDNNITFNNNSTSVNNDNFWITESQVNSQVWPELPEEIRKELETEWQRKKRQFPAVENKPSNNSKIQKKSSLKPSVTLTQMWGHREKRESDQLLQEISALPSDQFDHQVVLSLPRELQREIIDQWRAEEQRKKIKMEIGRPVEAAKPKNPLINPEKALKVQECLPIEFKGRSDWTCESIYAYVLRNKNSLDPSFIEETDLMLVELVLRECLAPVGNICGLLKNVPEFSEVLEKIQRLISDLYEGSTLKY